MTRQRKIDARCDDGAGLPHQRAGLEGDTAARSDISRAQGFTRGDGAGQHHRALPRFGIYMSVGVGGFSGPVVVWHQSFGRPPVHRSLRSEARGPCAASSIAFM